ncbi:MAG: peptide ABC transporter substrate-binding protein [Clostridia bacterium]|nr:peptide ABC transporter substrate-binding protein [Clostridia bacterium]
MKRNKLDPNTLSVCLASEPESLDPAKNSTSDGSTLLCHLFSGLARWSKDSGGGFSVVPDMATELTEPQENGDGTVTYTYVLREGLKWSDGKPLSASELVFSWNRAASPDIASDYGYMFENIVGYESLWDDTEGGALAVSADDEKRELKVTLKNELPYWNELLAFPVFFPVREDAVKDESWATSPRSYIGNGAYVMSEWAHDSVIRLSKNENFIDRSLITMPNIHFYLSDDTNNMLANFENRTWQFIDGVPIGEAETLKGDYPDEFHLEPQLGTYYTIWNAEVDLLPKDNTLSGAAREAANAEIRIALSKILDRNYICKEIGKGGQIPATSFVPAGLSDFDGSEFYKNANKGEGGSYGYYGTDRQSLEAAAENARTVLKKYFKFDTASGKFTNVPTVTYLYNTSDAHRAVGEYIQSKFASLGITVRLSNREWATFLEARKRGEYTIARSGWLADYNDPIAFLDMWMSGSENNDAGIGRGKNKDVRAYSINLTDIGMPEYNRSGATWGEAYDLLIRLAREQRDEEKRYALMHKAEDLLMQTGCVTPLYYYTDMYMLDSAVEGFYSNPLGVKYFMYCTVRE